jgi:hypothetical protein
MRWIASSALFLLPVFLPSWAQAQSVLDLERHPRFKSYFDPSQDTKRLACEVRPMPPRLNFAFHFVTGYFGTLPLKNFAGPGHRFAVLIRVTPDDSDRAPTYFSQLLQIGSAPGKIKGDAQLDGAFFVGAGGYRIDWVIADREGQTCRKSWHIEAKAPRRAPRTTLEAGMVAPLGFDPWPETLGSPDHPRRLTIYLHVAPLSMRRLKMHPFDQTMLLSSVLSLLQRGDFSSVKLVAFNFDQQKEIFRQDEFDEEGWRRLIRATGKLDLVTVPVSVLKNRDGHADLLKGFLEEELSAKRAADAVVFLGPTARQAEKLRLPEDIAARPGTRFYYFQYKPFWNRGNEYPDILSRVIHKLGGKTYHIYGADDFYQAITELKQGQLPVGKTVKSE